MDNDSIDALVVAKAGSYVVSSVSGKRIRIDKETVKKIFEPLFTAKKK